MMYANKNVDRIIYNDLKNKFPNRETLLLAAEHDNDSTFGYLLCYARDIFNLPKTIVWTAVEKLCKEYEVL